MTAMMQEGYLTDSLDTRVDLRLSREYHAEIMPPGRMPSGAPSLQPYFSVVIPLEFHRGQADRCVEAWTLKQTYPRDRFEVIVVAPDNFPTNNLRAIEELLSPNDRLLVSSERHDMPLCVEG